MPELRGQRIVVSAEMHLNFTAKTIWPLLCPVREYDWIETWDCKILHSESGFNESGCTFTTDLPSEGGKEVWLTSRYDPHQRLEFVRTNAIRIIHFVVKLKPAGKGTRLTWTQLVTALNEQGNDYVANKPKAFATQMTMLERMLAHYLETGKRLNIDTHGSIKRLKTHAHHR